MNRRRVCLVTSVHLFQNPRLVKEADALTNDGYDVRVVACQFESWMSEFDRALVHSRPWRHEFVDYCARTRPWYFWYSRLRQHSAKRLLASAPFAPGTAERALGRAVPELARLARKEPADVFIAHNLAALPAAAKAARDHSAKLGFDAEDFHSGMRLSSSPQGVEDEIIEYIERNYLPRCDTITAASEGIADAYTAKYGIRRPVPVLNMFPLAQRPRQRLPHDPSLPLRLFWFSQTIGINRGIEDIVKALALLSERNLELHLAGKWQAGYRDALYHLAASQGVKESQIVAQPSQPPDHLIRFASSYDIGLALEVPCCINRDICQTNKIFTYLLAGNSVIATATQGQTPLVQNIGDAGFLYKPGDVTALAERLEYLHNNRGALDASRDAAWNCASARYNWDLEQQTFLRTVAAALGRETTPAHEYQASNEIHLA